MPRDLTKTRYLDGLRCPKLLWSHWNRPEDVPPPDAARKPIIQSGRQVHDLAKRLMENGVEVPRFDTAEEAVASTAKLLEQRVTLFEAAFSVAGRHCRADVLIPVGDGHWDLVEVKAGGKVRESHIRDLAFQYDTISRAGLEIDSMYVVHLRSDYVRRGDLDLEQLFKYTDVTERVMALVTYTDRTIRALQDMVQGPDPDTPIGSRCNVPHPCPMKPVCWADLPPDNVTILHRGGRKAWELMDEGLFTLASVPDERITVHQRLQKRAVVSGETRFDHEGVGAWLRELTWPVHFLDFETMAPAVPAFDGARPYQQIPFQYSLHIQREPGAEPEHLEFLATEPDDPRGPLAEALVQDIEPEGTVLAWNVDFERLVLQELADHDPANGIQIALVIERLADLMWPFTAFLVHHPAQQGSCSLKAVLPAVTDLDYSDLDIAEGAAATHCYERAMFGGISPAARGRIFSDLRDYCRRDTQALVAILDWLHAESVRRAKH